MTVLVLLIFASLGVALVFLAGFIWAARSGQFDDTCTPSLRLLTDDEPGAQNHVGPDTKSKSTPT